MLFNSTIKEEIKKKIFQITKREKQEQSTTQLKDSFDTFSLSFFPKNRKGRARKKKIHKSDTETVFPPSNVPMDSLPGKARANSLKMHTFPPLYDLSFAITIHPFSNFERDNVRGNPVSPLTWTVCTDSADDSALPLPLSPSSSPFLSLHWLYWLPRSETDDLIPCRFTHRFLRFRIIYQRIRYNRFNCAALILSLSRTRSSLGSFPSDWTWSFSLSMNRIKNSFDSGIFIPESILVW